MYAKNHTCAGKVGVAACGPRFGALRSRPVQPLVNGVDTLDAPLTGSVVTLGAFDGVHRGHQALIHVTVEAARSFDVPALGFTFHPHPAKVLAPHRAPQLLMSLDERVKTMRGFGLDAVVVQPFDSDFAEVSADAFVEDFLVAKLRPRQIVVGFNFAYGKGRGGNLKHLRDCGRRFGFEVHVVEPVAHDESVCSSTLIRRRLVEGDVAGVRTLLGRDHALTGVVVKGDQRGRTIGFPTANIDTDAELLPKVGVYATRLHVLGEAEPRASVCNIGRRPTFKGVEVRVEAHVMDFDGDLYGKRVRLQLVQRLRDEERFDGLEALKAQLGRDVATARAGLSL